MLSSIVGYYSLSMYRSNLQLNSIFQIGLLVGAALALLLFASFGRIAELFSKDPMVLQIVGSGVLVCAPFFCHTTIRSSALSTSSLPVLFLFLKFVSASQPINALAFIFDGLHFGVSDFSYSASSMVYTLT